MGKTRSIETRIYLKLARKDCRKLTSATTVHQGALGVASTACLGLARWCYMLSKQPQEVAIAHYASPSSSVRLLGVTSLRKASWDRLLGPHI